MTSANPMTAPDSRVTVGHNDDGTLDEVVGTGDFHLEQMDTNAWWMQLGPHMVWLRARGKITAHFGENEALARGPQQAGGDGGCDHLNEVLAHISNGIDDIADDDHRALPQLREAWYHAGMAKAERDALQAEVARLREKVKFDDMAMTAVANDLRACGCSFDGKRTPIIRNDRAEAAEAALREARKALQAWADWEDGLVSGMADRRDKAMCLTRIFLNRAALNGGQDDA